MYQPHDFESQLMPISRLRDDPAHRQYYYEGLKFEGFPLVESPAAIIEQKIPTTLIRRISASVVRDQGIAMSSFSLEMRFWNTEAARRSSVDDAGYTSDDPRWGLSQAIRWAISIWEDEAMFRVFDPNGPDLGAGINVTLYEFRGAGAEDAEMRSRWD